MIVEEHDCGRSNGGCLAKHLARMNHARVQRPDGHDRCPHDAVLGIEQQHAEVLDPSASELRNEKLGGVARLDDLRPLAPAANQRSPSRFYRGKQLRRTGAANSGNPPEFVGRCSCESMQPSDRGEDRVREFERAALRGPVTEHEREQFVVAKTRNADAFELFARSIVRLDALHATSIVVILFRCVV